MGIARVVKAAAVLAIVLIGLSCPAALAEVSLDTKSVAASSDVTITVVAPPEVGVANERVSVDVPIGFRVISCDNVEGFLCSHAKAADPIRTVVTWQSVGPVRSLAVRSERFPFQMRTIGRPGAYAFPVSQFYADGSASHWRGTADDERPAPVLEVTAAGPRPAGARPTATTVTVARRAEVRTLSVTATTLPPWARDRTPHVVDLAVQQDVPVVASEPPVDTDRGPLMLSLGVAATIAAGAVYWLRRRIATLDA